MTIGELVKLVGDSRFGFGMGPNVLAYTYLDSDYRLPTREWVAGPFANALKTNIELLTKGAGYKPESWDCDDYALLTMTLARLTHAREYSGPASLAFGFIGYVSFATFPRGAHAINTFAVMENAPKLLFFEPQTGQIVELLEDEIASIRTLII